MRSTIATRPSHPLAMRWVEQVRSFRESVSRFNDVVLRARERRLARVEDRPVALDTRTGDQASLARQAAAKLRLPHADSARALTPRQCEVAALIAAGYTNEQIAAELVITRGTVANHVEHMLNRLGFRSRSQIAAWAAERGVRKDVAETA